MEDHAPHYACCELSCFFFTEVSQMKERNLVNSVHDDMLMTFPLDFSEFFSIRLTRKWKTTGHIMQAVIFGCFLSWKYRLNQSKTNDQWENFY